MTVTFPDQPAWPDGDPGKVLLNCIISTDVDEVFEELFGSYPQTQAKLHKQRNDSNCAESPWVSQRSQLPAQQFVWPAPPAGADPGTATQGSWRKVRFDAPPSMASKAFQSEEVQHVMQLQPGSHYRVDTEVSTTAMYGDQFTVLSRYTLAAKGAGKAHLHVLYAIAFKPSLSRLMKPMVAKGVDGGIRGSFSVLKKLLQEQYGLSDLPDSVPAATLPGAGAAAAAAAASVQAVPEAAVPAPVPATQAPAAPAPGLLALADYVVYQDLVASIVKVSDPQLVAKALAMCLTLVLINTLLVLLRPISQACARAGAAAAAGGAAGVMSWLCWPVAVGFDIPDSLGEVLGALLLVAVANKVLLVGVEVVAGAMYGGSSPSVAASRQPSVLGAALSAVAAAASSGPAAANGHPSADARSQPTASTTAAPGDAHAAAQQLLSPGRSAPIGVPGKAANGSAGGSTGTGSGGGVEAALASFGTAMTGWGRNLLGGVDSLSNNEGIKALVSGSWSRSSGETGKANDAGQGPGGASAAADSKRLSSAGPGPGRAPSHRPSSSFSGFMDPSGLNIIEDYAMQQANDSGLPQLLEEQSTAGSSPAASEGGPFTAAAAASARAAAVSAERQASGATAEGIRSNSPARSGSPGKGAGRSSSPSKMKRAGSSKKSLSEGDGDAEARQPLLSSVASGDGSRGSLDMSSSQAGSTSHRQGPGQGTSRPTTPVPGDDYTPPLLSSSSPVVISSSRQQQQQHVVRNSKSVSFSQSPEATDTTSSTHGPLMGSHSAAAVMSGPSGLTKSAGGMAGSTHTLGSRVRSTSPLARRSASPLLYGASPQPELGLSRASSSYEPLPGSSGSGYVAPVEPGQEDEVEVLVEVFEHERVQPFRGWGHTWPGHFLPSDKVGHWGDRTGAPGGATSMLFDRVAPKLPVGWTWQDQEWTVDMTGAEQEGCDVEGWAYGMDFTWLTWPPAPQSGKPGIKSFVRRRRWVRMRARLPPGAADEAGSQPEGVRSHEDEPQPEPVFVVRGGEGQQGEGASSGPLGSRDSISNSDGGFMAGLGLGPGLGLVSHDSASAAAAAAGAMVSRWMKVVQDLPLAPRGSSSGSGSGSGDGFMTSPPPGPESPGSTAAAAAGPTAAARAPSAGAPAIVDAESSVLSGAPSAAVRAAGPSGSNSDGEAGAVPRAAGGTAGETSTSVAGAQQQQQQQGPGSSSKDSNGGGSLRKGGDSGAASDSDSSSVDSDSPPPRPRLSQAMAGMHTGDDVPALAQPNFEPDAAAAVDAVSRGAAGGAVESHTAAAVSTATAAEVSKAAAGGPAGAQAGEVASASPILPVEELSAGATDPGAVTEVAAGASLASTAAPAAAGAGQALPEGRSCPAAAEVSSVAHPAAAAPGDDQPQEGLPVPAAQTTTPAVSCAVEQEQQNGAAAGAADEHLDTAARMQQAAVASVFEEAAAEAGSAAEGAAGEATFVVAEKHVPVEASTSAAAGSNHSPGEAPAAPVSVAAGAVPGSKSSSSPGHSVSTPQPEDVPAVALGSHDAAGAGMLASSPAPGSGQGALGSGDWVWSAAAADAAAASSLHGSGVVSGVQQSGREEGGISEDLPTSPLAADSPPYRQQQQQGVGNVSRSSSGSGSGAAGRGVVRTGSGARGSKGRQPKLGAVPLRRSGEGASAGGAHSSSSGGLAGSGGSGAAEALAAAAAAATVAVPAQAAIRSGSGSGAGDEVTRDRQPSGAVPAPAPAAAAAGAAAPDAVLGMQDAAVAQQVSGDDMGSGLGWASPPDRHMPAAAAAAVHRARGQQQQRAAGSGQQDAGQQDRKDW